MRNLLYFQAELQLLEVRLEELDEADKYMIAGLKDSREILRAEAAARSWEDLQKQAREGDVKLAEKLGIIYEIRALMKEYGKR